MNIVIVSTSNSQQEELWQKHLTQVKDLILSPTVQIICVAEDWIDGAGNGLGTLYAYQKACQKAKALFNFDLMKAQQDGASINLYHTAGKGKRLYPVAASEFGNKSAIKLPGFIPHSDKLLSILEAVIMQTSSLFSHRQGRLSVFWGDQIFVPTKQNSNPQHHIEILSKNIPLPTKEEWIKNNYHQYGCIFSDQKNHIQSIFEKLDADSYASLIDRKSDFNFGLSLGCFSLSYEILSAFLNFFKRELEQKEGRLDTDADLWMPLVLNADTYMATLKNKKIDSEKVVRHYERLQLFKQKFCSQNQKPFFGNWNIGDDALWLDYGCLNSYFKNNIAILNQTPANQFLRQFFGWNHLSSSSFLHHTTFKSGNVKNSILINVEADHLEVSDCIIINSKLNFLKANQCLLYQVKEEAPLTMNEGDVRADVDLTNQYLKLYSKLDCDGKASWNTILPSNLLSFSEISNLII